MNPLNAAYYEVEHGVGGNHYLFERNQNHSFPLHMHRCFEMVLMLEGEMEIRIDQETYVLRAGDLILVKPNRIHSYETPEGKGGVCLLCVFSGDLIAAVNEILARNQLRSVVIHDLPSLYREVFASMETAEDLPTVKGILYLLCALFCRLAEDRTEDVTGDTALLHHMFAYVEDHVSTPCTLLDLSRKLKYNESYLSRYFVENVGISFSEYVRGIKINRACYLLRNTDESVYSISAQCGYANQSSFNRSFKQMMGVSPNEYRAGS